MESLIQLSRKYGNDFSLVQAGGGNSSYKSDNLLWVKASGYEMANIDAGGFVCVDRKGILAFLEDSKLQDLKEHTRDANIVQTMQSFLLKGHQRPSIETFLHALLPHSYVIHLHSILLNGMTCRLDGEKLAQNLFTGFFWGWVGYEKPGLPLAWALQKALPLDLDPRIPYAVFLQNHGIVLAASSVEELDLLLHQMLQSAQVFLGAWRWHEPDIQDSAFQTAIKNQLNGVLYPDHVVFCGGIGIEAKHETFEDACQIYFKRYQTHPRYGIIDGQLQIFSDADPKRFLRLLKAHMDTFELASRQKGTPQFLPEDEIFYLLHWESETYRQRLGDKR